MEIAIILLAFVMFGALIAAWLTVRKFDGVIDSVADLALHVTDREDWENATFERHAERLDDIDETLVDLDGDQETVEVAVGEVREQLAALVAKLNELAKRMDDFEDLADEGVQARIDADKAWAEGVRSLANYGMNVPKLTTEDLNNG
jgi:chromosome segregation ATPase